MSDTRVSRSSVMKLGGVEGDLIVEDGGVVEGLATGGLIEVVGEVRCEGGAEFRTTLSCADFHAEGGRVEIQGDLSSRGEVRVEDGELDVSGSMQTREVDADKRLKVGKDLKAESVDVGGVLEVGGSIDARTADVGGIFKVGGDASVAEIDVGGTLDVEGTVNSTGLDVGGKATIGGGEVRAPIEGGGLFQRSKLVKFARTVVCGSRCIS